MNQQYDCLTYAYPSRQAVDIPQFLAAAARSLKAGGMVSVRDIVVPGSRLRGKKAEQQRRAGQHVNAFLQMSWPGHGRGLSQSEWQDVMHQAGFSLVYERVTAVAHPFHEWAVSLAPADRLRLQALLIQAPAPVLDYLTLHGAGDRITFHLQELWMVGKLTSHHTSG